MALANFGTLKFIRLLILVFIALPVVSANVDCGGKAFHCVNTTHFKICVDLGGGVSKTIDSFIIPCPTSTECRKTNRYECEFTKPVILETVSATSVPDELSPFTADTSGSTLTEFLQSVTGSSESSKTELYKITTDISEIGKMKDFKVPVSNSEQGTTEHLQNLINTPTNIELIEVPIFTTEFYQTSNQTGMKNKTKISDNSTKIMNTFEFSQGITDFTTPAATEILEKYSQVLDIQSKVTQEVVEISAPITTEIFQNFKDKIVLNETETFEVSKNTSVTNNIGYKQDPTEATESVITEMTKLSKQTSLTNKSDFYREPVFTSIPRTTETLKSSTYTSVTSKSDFSQSHNGINELITAEIFKTSTDGIIPNETELFELSTTSRILKKTDIFQGPDEISATITNETFQSSTAANMLNKKELFETSTDSRVLNTSENYQGPDGISGHEILQTSTNAPFKPEVLKTLTDSRIFNISDMFQRSNSIKSPFITEISKNSIVANEPNETELFESSTTSRVLKKSDIFQGPDEISSTITTETFQSLSVVNESYKTELFETSTDSRVLNTSDNYYQVPDGISEHEMLQTSTNALKKPEILETLIDSRILNISDMFHKSDSINVSVTTELSENSTVANELNKTEIFEYSTEFTVSNEIFQTSTDGIIPNENELFELSTTSRILKKSDIFQGPDEISATITNATFQPSTVANVLNKPELFETSTDSRALNTSDNYYQVLDGISEHEMLQTSTNAPNKPEVLETLTNSRILNISDMFQKSDSINAPLTTELSENSTVANELNKTEIFESSTESTLSNETVFPQGKHKTRELITAKIFTTTNASVLNKTDLFEISTDTNVYETVTNQPDLFEAVSDTLSLITTKVSQTISDTNEHFVLQSNSNGTSTQSSKDTMGNDKNDIQPTTENSLSNKSVLHQGYLEIITLFKVNVLKTSIESNILNITDIYQAPAENNFFTTTKLFQAATNLTTFNTTESSQAAIPRMEKNYTATFSPSSEASLKVTHSNVTFVIDNAKENHSIIDSNNHITLATEDSNSNNLLNQNITTTVNNIFLVTKNVSAEYENSTAINSFVGVMTVDANSNNFVQKNISNGSNDLLMSPDKEYTFDISNTNDLGIMASSHRPIDSTMYDTTESYFTTLSSQDFATEENGYTSVVNTFAVLTPPTITIQDYSYYNTELQGFLSINTENSTTSNNVFVSDRIIKTTALNDTNLEAINNEYNVSSDEISTSSVNVTNKEPIKVSDSTDLPYEVLTPVIHNSVTTQDWAAVGSNSQLETTTNAITSSKLHSKDHVESNLNTPESYLNISKGLHEATVIDDLFSKNTSKINVRPEASENSTQMINMQTEQIEYLSNVSTLPPTDSQIKNTDAATETSIFKAIESAVTIVKELTQPQNLSPTAKNEFKTTSSLVATSFDLEQTGSINSIAETKADHKKYFVTESNIVESTTTDAATETSIFKALESAATIGKDLTQPHKLSPTSSNLEANGLGLEQTSSINSIAEISEDYKKHVVTKSNIVESKTTGATTDTSISKAVKSAATVIKELAKPQKLLPTPSSLVANGFDLEQTGSINTITETTLDYKEIVVKESNIVESTTYINYLDNTESNLGNGQNFLTEITKKTTPSGADLQHFTKPISAALNIPEIAFPPIHEQKIFNSKDIDFQKKYNVQQSPSETSIKEQSTQQRAMNTLDKQIKRVNQDVTTVNNLNINNTQFSVTGEPFFTVSDTQVGVIPIGMNSTKSVSSIAQSLINHMDIPPSSNTYYSEAKTRNVNNDGSRISLELADNKLNESKYNVTRSTLNSLLNNTIREPTVDLVNKVEGFKNTTDDQGLGTNKAVTSKADLKINSTSLTVTGVSKYKASETSFKTYPTESTTKYRDFVNTTSHLNKDLALQRKVHVNGSKNTIKDNLSQTELKNYNEIAKSVILKNDTLRSNVRGSTYPHNTTYDSDIKAFETPNNKPYAVEVTAKSFINSNTYIKTNHTLKFNGSTNEVLNVERTHISNIPKAKTNDVLNRPISLLLNVSKNFALPNKSVTERIQLSANGNYTNSDKDQPFAAHNEHINTTVRFMNETEYNKKTNRLPENKSEQKEDKLLLTHNNTSQNKGRNLTVSRALESASQLKSDHHSVIPSDKNMKGSSLIPLIEGRQKVSTQINTKRPVITIPKYIGAAQATFIEKDIALVNQTQRTVHANLNNNFTSTIARKTTKITRAHATINNEKKSISFNCRNRNRGRYSDPDDCNKFYICIGKREPIIGRCPVNTVFSELKKQCTNNMSHCVRGSEFKCTAEGRFIDIFKQNVYYICLKSNQHFIRYKFQCQRGYCLNKTLVKCIENSELEMQSQTSISNDNSKSEVSNNEDNKSNKDKSKPRHSQKSGEKFECEEEGKFADGNDCRRYYVCKKNHKSEFRRRKKKCDSDELFHKDRKKCVDAESYEC